MEDSAFLRYCIYHDAALGDRYDPLPGMRLSDVLYSLPVQDADFAWIQRKIEQSCRKLLLMWKAGELALEAERSFYSKTIQDAPALFGEDAVSVQYHLEALVFFARSALDIASSAFGALLPLPFPRKRYDSFNEFLKAVSKVGAQYSLTNAVEVWRQDENGWLRLVAEIERGRSLRDQLAHQMGFPIDYEELTPGSEKESPVVVVSPQLRIHLPEFIETLRVGTVESYLTFETACLSLEET